MPNFGFTFVFKRSSKQFIHSRTVYTILEFLGDVGGLNDALTLIFAPFLSFFVPSLLARSILNKNFKFDDDGAHSNDQPAQNSNKKIKLHADQILVNNTLAERLQNTFDNITLQRSDLLKLSYVYSMMKHFSVSFCTAVIADNCAFYCRRKRSVKIYQAGKEKIVKKIDIVRLVRNSLDLELLKKLYLLPN